jgi:regulatory protein
LIITKILQKRNIVEIYSSDLLLFKCSINFVTDNRLYIDKDIENIDEMRYLANLSIIYKKLFDYSSSKLLSTNKAKELIKRYSNTLKIKIYNEDIENLITRLKELLLINDNAFLDLKIRSLISKKKGKNFIGSKMQSLGFSKDETATAMGSLYNDDEMHETLKSLLSKKSNILSKRFTGRDLQNKLLRFGMSKGYDFKEVKKCIEENKLI